MMETTLVNHLDQRIANLSPAKRTLLERYLQEKAVPAVPSLTIPQRADTTPPPLSFAQQRLWFLEQLQPGMTAYNLSTTYRLQGALNRAALQQALTAILHRHESQRTTFAVRHGVPQQIINPPINFPLPIEDLRALPADQWDAAIQQHVSAENKRPFDLTQDLMWRAHLLYFDEQTHVLILTSHHIASDGWSGSVFRRELTSFYAAFVDGLPLSLPPLPIQYADYSVWQHQWLQSEQAQAQLAYWKQQLADVPPMLELPTDRPRPVVQRFQGAEYTFTLSPQLIAGLKRVSQQENATLFMGLIAGFNLVLQRYTGQDDLLIGTAIAGRNQPELEEMIGFFINNLVLRTRLTDEMTVRDLLQQIRTTTLNAYANQMLPFEKLLEVLRPERGLSHTSLFQVMFILQNTPPNPFALTGLQAERLHFDNNETKFDITVSASEQAGGVRGVIRYRTDLFDQSTIVRLCQHYETLLAGMVRNVDGRVVDLPLLSATEQQQLISARNATALNFEPALNIVQRFQSIAARQPTATAFICERQHLTFQALNLQANQLAHYLRTIGIEPGMRVGICLERSFEVPIGLLAIFKVGGVYVPLDPRHPPARLARMIQDADIAAIITRRAWLTSLPDTATTTIPRSVQVLCLDQMKAVLAAQPITDSPITPMLDTPAYILFTSGSTGQPKGVIVPYRYVHNRLNWTWHTYPLAPHECGCQNTSFTFTDSIWEMLGYLLQGRPAVIIADPIVREPHLFLSDLAEHNVTRLWLTPSLLRTLLDLYPDLQKQLPALKFWVTTGEPLARDLVEQFQTALPHATLYNHYGSTEASSTAWWDASQGQKQLTDVTQPVPIGHPTANVRTYILDRQLRPVPIGVLGELHVSGANLACGYLNQPALTAERFIPDPFCNEPGARLYKTGDLARYLPDGQIALYGRADFQVKLRGFRIELGEIEAALNQHPAVRQSVALLGETPVGDKQLLAYVVCKADMTVSTQALKAYVTDQVPGYMIPNDIVILDALPLTLSGKVDRRALPAPTTRQSQTGRPTASPTDVLELHLCQIWETVLKVHPIQIHDNFFELGGHSLLAVQLFEQIATLTGKRLPVATLFQAPTVAQLADCLRQQDWQPPWQPLLPIQTNGNKPPLFIAPPGGSTVLRSANITRHLAADQPVYGFQYLGFEPGEEPHRTIDAMAAYYVEHICTLQPTGPYFLAGLCFGNDLMLEVAQQLRGRGQEVAMLILIDPGGPPNGPSWQRPKRFSRGYWPVLLTLWRKRGIWPWLKARIAYRRRIILDKLQRKPTPLRTIHQQSKLTYQAQVYEGQTYLIQSEEFARHPQIRARWTLISTKALDYTVIPASTHDSLVFQVDHAQQVAAQVTHLLQQAIEQRS